MDDWDGDAFAGRVRRDRRERAWSVLTVHADMEGVAFQTMAGRLLSGLWEEGVTFFPLKTLAAQVGSYGGRHARIRPVARPLAAASAGKAGFVGDPLPSPGRVAWKVHRERVLLLGWGRAILLQFAHPLVAAGVADHSAFRAGGWG